MGGFVGWVREHGHPLVCANCALVGIGCVAVAGTAVATATSASAAVAWGCLGLVGLALSGQAVWRLLDGERPSPVPGTVVVMIEFLAGLSLVADLLL